MAEPVPFLCLQGESEISMPEDRQLAMLASEICDSLHAVGVAIAIAEGERIVCRARAGSSAPDLGAFLDQNAGISGRCIREARPMRVYDCAVDPRVDSDVCRHLGIRSLAAVPILHNQRVAGIIEVFSRLPGAFEQDSLRDLTVFAEYASTLMLEPASQAHPTRRPEPPSDAANIFLPSESDPPSDSANQQSAPAEKTFAPPQFLYGSDLRSVKSKRILPAIICACIAVLFAGFLLLAAQRHKTQKVSLQSLQTGSDASTQSSPKTSTASSPRDSQPQSPQLSQKAQNGTEPTNASQTYLLERAKAGDVQSQIALADSYAAGDGEIDVVQAGTWYIVAGFSGSHVGKQRATRLTAKLSQSQIAQIRFNVGKIFEDGMGLGPDLISAYSWMVLAQAAGDARAEGEQKKIAEILTPNEVSEAHHRAQQWIASHRLVSRTRSEVTSDRETF